MKETPVPTDHQAGCRLGVKGAEMTLLNWEMTPEHVVILSDTLSLSSEDKRPRNFMTKIYPAPHIGAVITGTGIGQVVTDFYVRTVAEMVVDDVVHLAQFAPNTLRAIWSRIVEQLPAGATTTIYTFGLSKKDSEFTGFAYRSTANFEAEQLQHGIGVKPPLESCETGPINGLEDFVRLAYSQQAEDRARPRGERVGIGGELWMYTMLKDESGALVLKIECLGALLYSDNDHEVMLARLPNNEGHLRSLLALARDL